jgi:hypothetical protein
MDTGYGHTNGNGLRARIFELLRQSETPEEDWVLILSQCAAQVRDRALVTRVARECGLTLAGSRSDTSLELYFDIAHGEQELGYIAKGWDDPGFRIGDVVEVSPGKIVTLTTNAFQIMRVCATQGIGISIHERPDGIELALDGVIYSEGFSRETFRQTLDAVCECARKVRGLVGNG